MRLILVRHGETELNRLGRIQGINSAPLTEEGRRQARAAAVALRPDAPFVLYTSPLARAVETAEMIAAETGATPTRDDGLVEMDVGGFEGLSGAQMRERYPEVMRMWDEDPAATFMPDGENLTQVRGRAWSAVTRMAERHESDTVVAVTHNFPIQMIICSALDMPLNSFRRLRVDLCSLTRFEFSARGVTQLSVNETWHLR